VADETVASLRAAHDALAARLAEGGADTDLASLKRDIGILFKTVEQQIAELTALRASVLQLVESWKALRSAQPSIAPTFDGARPVVHVDHIGASTYVDKGWTMISGGDFTGAERVLTKALQLSPDDPQAEALLGWAQMLQDNFDDALLNFQKVLAREPQNALARVNVGYICLKKRIFGEAIEHLSRAIRIDNDKKAILYAHLYLGLVYLEREMYEDAQTFFEKAIVLGPNLIEAYYELGRAYWHGGRQDEAKETWSRGAAANRFNPWGKRCAAVLESVARGGAP
jgi:tetratricopeptide (TPR) repeat protein